MPGTNELFILMLAIATVALLYASVGHGGASGYIAVMALAGFAPAMIKPTALLLNLVVATVAVLLFAGAGHFRWRLFWPFALTSVPASFLGGGIVVPNHLLKPLLGVCLLFAAARLIWRGIATAPARPLSVPLALVAGGVMGLVAGMTGVGGGIFLSPLLLFARWADARETAATSALFILVNSAAGLAGHLGSLAAVPAFAPWLALAALAGGLCGSFAGSGRLPVPAIARTLTAVLTIAGMKLILT